MKRAYIARLELEYIVVAESEESARQLAMKDFEYDQVSAGDFEIGAMTHVPNIYDDCDEVRCEGGDVMTTEEASRLAGGYNHA